jgi:hypothetical protein
MPNIEKDPRFWVFNTKIGRIILLIIFLLIVVSILIEFLTS